MTNVWWVNQGRSYRDGEAPDFIYAPQKTRDERSNPFYDNVLRVEKGDVIIHYARKKIRAISRASSGGYEADPPKDLRRERWERKGYQVDVDAVELESPIELEEIPREWRTRGSSTPFQSDGEVKVGYLFKLDSKLIEGLKVRFEDRWPEEFEWEPIVKRQVFVFTAGGSEARKHLDASIRSSIDRATVLSDFSDDLRSRLEEIWESAGGFYAWGATPGPQNIENWEKLERGDWVLCGFDSEYRYVSRVLDKFDNRQLAEDVWGINDRNETWQYLYFLSKPHEVKLSYSSLAPPLHEGYFGFTRIAEDRLERMEEEAGSIDSFIETRLLDGADENGGSKRKKISLAEVAADFSDALGTAGLSFGSDHNAVVRDFVVSLATKQLIILTGLSGSGKTQIALQFGRWLSGADEKRYRVVPVRPDWTGPEALFGYEDALQETRDGRKAWHVPEPLKFMLQAARDEEHPYLMVLDEMNLAHVERYFADVISGMESGEPCLPNLRAEEDGTWRKVPGAGEPDLLPFPDNLFIAGTVNVDETTYMFSPKVLDRANTLEFRVETEDLQADIRKPGACEPGDPALVCGFLEIASDEGWHLEHPPDGKGRFVDRLKDLHRELDSGFSFGHRVLYEAVRYAALHREAGGNSMEDALDVQVLQKVLPRIHGSRRRVESVLRTVGKFCWDLEPTGDEGAGADGFDPTDDGLDPDAAALPRSFDKVQRMTERLRANQFVSFTE